MTWSIDNHNYTVIIERKNNKHTYIRVLPDISIFITTNYFTTNQQIKKLLTVNEVKIKNMIEQQQQKNV